MLHPDSNISAPPLDAKFKQLSINETQILHGTSNRLEIHERSSENKEEMILKKNPGPKTYNNADIQTKVNRKNSTDRSRKSSRNRLISFDAHLLNDFFNENRYKSYWKDRSFHQRHIQI